MPQGSVARRVPNLGVAESMHQLHFQMKGVFAQTLMLPYSVRKAETGHRQASRSPSRDVEQKRDATRAQSLRCPAA